MVAERLDATTYQLDSRNQHEMYGKVGGAIVTGESDGGQASIKSILYDLSIAGLTVPPNSDVYWVGEAGLGGPYLEAEGDTSLLRQRAGPLDGPQPDPSWPGSSMSIPIRSTSTNSRKRPRSRQPTGQAPSRPGNETRTATTQATTSSCRSRSIAVSRVSSRLQKQNRT